MIVTPSWPNEVILARLPRKSRLPEGKIPISVLNNVLETIPKGELFVRNTRVGMDAAIVKSRGNYFSSVSGVARGKKPRLAHDLVVELSRQLKKVGSKPRIVCPVILFPKHASSEDIKNVISEIAEGATEIGLTVAKGHTEIVSWLDERTITMSVIGSSVRRPHNPSKKR